jgi:hypothetical protein
MTKVLKIIARSLHGIVEWLLLFLIIFAFAIRTSPVQTFLANFATDYLSKKLGTVISIEKVDIVFVDKVDLKGVLLLNKNQSDTIINVKSLLVDVDGISAFQKQIHLNSVLLEGGVVKIEKDAETGEMNLKFVIDYFKSDKPKSKKTLPFIIDKANLKGIRFHYDNNLISPKQDGMDYQHLLLSEINLDAKKITFEKSGFRLDNFDVDLKMSNQGVDLKDVNIITPLTNLNSKRFQLKYNSYTQFKSFVDSVAFDADLYDSYVSFSDIAIFAPQLAGMDQKVQIEGKFTKFVKDLRAENFIIKTGDKTELRGTINLPDFRHLKESFYQERINYAYIDLKELQEIKLPKTSSKRMIHLDENVSRLGYFEAQDVRLDGIYSQFVLSSDEVKTALGSVNMDNGILFTHNPKNQSFLFSHSEASEYDVKINEFNLGGFLNNSLVGVVDGTFFLNGEAFSFSDIHFNKIAGNVNRFDLADYSYSGITVKNASFLDKILYAEVDVDDRNLSLNYTGKIDLNGEPKMDMEIGVKKALLGKLNITENDSTNFVAKINLHTKGLNPNLMSGIAEMQEVIYTEGSKKIIVPKMTMVVERGLESDRMLLKSPLLNASIAGKIDFNSIGDIIQDQASHLFPGFHYLKHREGVHLDSEDNMVFNVQIIDVNTLLNIFQPKLYISPGTFVKGNYDASKRFFEMDVLSDKVMFDKMVARGINLSQSADSMKIQADYKLTSFSLNDSITLDNVRFVANGNGDNLSSRLTWNPNTENSSDIQWATRFESDSRILFTFEPSYFSINRQHWNIERAAVITIDSMTIDVASLRLTSEEQFITIHGRASTNDEDKLNFELNEVNLQKLGEMLGLDVALEGRLNGWGVITNPYTNLTYMGDVSVKGLVVDNEEVGDVYILSQWDDRKNMIDLSGDLIYRGIPTFQFKGNYDISKESDNLDFDLVFDQTNIAFANAFMDPLVIDDIKGFINGELDVKGSLSRPIIEGQVNLDNASAKIAMLGTSFSFTGPMYADKDGFYIDYRLFNWVYLSSGL